MNKLQKHTIEQFTTLKGAHFQDLTCSYQLFGCPLHSAPVVLVIHALTGNSAVSGEGGWWNGLIGYTKTIDLNQFTVIAFNILGNGFDGQLIQEYKTFIAKDIARLQVTVLRELGVVKLHSIIGGSLGGGIAWEMAGLYPDFAKTLIPIATDWKSSDWIIGHNYIQERLLENSPTGLEDARTMAMLFYRSPAALKQKFNRTKTEDREQFNVSSWLNHHGKKLESRFQRQAYLMMNHLLSTINFADNEEQFKLKAKRLKSRIIQVSVSSDLFFIPEEVERTKQLLDEIGIENELHSIASIDGHDAFLIETERLSEILNPVYKQKLQSTFSEKTKLMKTA